MNFPPPTIITTINFAFIPLTYVAKYFHFHFQPTFIPIILSLTITIAIITLDLIFYHQLKQNCLIK